MTSSIVRFEAGLPALCSAAFVFAAVVFAPAVLSSGDLYWHISAGRWMIENQAVLRIDPFSFTFAGHPWPTREWLAEICLALAYVGAGWAGVMALAAFVAGTAAGLLALFLSRFWQGGLLVAGVLLSLICATSAVMALPYLLALPFVVVWTAGLITARADKRRPAYGLLPALFVWANLDASFVLGLLIALVLGLEAVLQAVDAKERLTAARNWSVFAGYAFVACLATPYGFEGLAQALRGLLPQLPIQTLLPLLLALPAASLLLRHRKTWLRAGSLGAFLALALTQPADRLIFAVVAPLLVADVLSAAPIPRRFVWKPVLALVFVVSLGLVLRLVTPVERPDSAFTPAAAFAMVPEALSKTAVLNEEAFGGFLLFHNVRPFIDSRPLYSASFRSRVDGLGDPARLQKTLARYHIRWTILAPSNPAVTVLDGLKGWHRLHADRFAVIHVRNDAL